MKYNRMETGKEGYEKPSLTVVGMETADVIMSSPIGIMGPKGGVFINQQKGGKILDNGGGWDGWDNETSSFSSGNSRGF